MVWVDVLFVVSSLLAALQLIPLLEERRKGAPSSTQVLLAYWRRRAWRIVPAYAVANLLAAVALGPAEVAREAAAARWLHFYHCPRTLWVNALFVQNWLGNQACGKPAGIAVLFCT
jgi:peptidoglycan/LPS O-acetylase OafA/YrhL